MAAPNGFASYVGTDVVLDTKSPLVYIGRLEEADEWFLVLAEVDVHDRRDSHSTKDVYLMEAKKFGIRKNRERATVRANDVISISKLDDVTVY